jgi:hypothetical protein
MRDYSDAGMRLWIGVGYELNIFVALSWNRKTTTHDIERTSAVMRTESSKKKIERHMEQSKSDDTDPVSPSTLNVYLLSITNFILFLYQREKTAESEYVCPLTEQVKNLLSEHSRDSISKQKKMLKAKLQENSPIPVVDCTKLSDQHFVQFIASLKKSNGQSLSSSALNTHRAAFGHLHTMHGQKLPSETSDALASYYKFLKARTAETTLGGDIKKARNTLVT